MIEALAASPAPAALALLGLLVGSFLTTVVHRLPARLEWLWANGDDPAADGAPAGIFGQDASCPKCGHALAWQERVPVLGWLLQRGRCASCGERIALRYPLTEIGCAVLFVAVGLTAPSWLRALPWCGFLATLLALALIDWDTLLLPDELTLPLMWAGLIAAATGWGGLPPSQAIWGAVAGYVSLWAVHWAFALLTGQEGLGYGDFKLMAAMGAWLGPLPLLPLVMGASILSTTVGLYMKSRGLLREGRFLPFGPFLAGAGGAIALAGPTAVLRWLGLS